MFYKNVSWSVQISEDVGELTTELVEKMEHFNVGQEKISTLKTVAIKLEVLSDFNASVARFIILGTLLRMGSWRIVSYLLSNLPEKFFQKSHGGRAESLAAALEGSLGQVSPF